MESKADIRARMRRKRQKLLPEWVREHSAPVCARLADLPCLAAADTVCLYLALPGEVDLSAAITLCHSRGQRILVPAYRQDSDDYAFKQLYEASEIAPSLWGVPEPVGADWSDPVGRTCILVPGVAFSKSGDRVGHGKGYYDRLLADAARKSECLKIGICFNFQLVDSLPCEPWDIAMDMVVAENSINRNPNFVDRFQDNQQSNANTEKRSI